MWQENKNDARPRVLDSKCLTIIFIRSARTCFYLVPLPVTRSSTINRLLSLINRMKIEKEGQKYYLDQLLVFLRYCKYLLPPLYRSLYFFKLYPSRFRSRAYLKQKAKEDILLIYAIAHTIN